MSSNNQFLKQQSLLIHVFFPQKTDTVIGTTNTINKLRCTCMKYIPLQHLFLGFCSKIGEDFVFVYIRVAPNKLFSVVSWWWCSTWYSYVCVCGGWGNVCLPWMKGGGTFFLQSSNFLFSCNLFKFRIFDWIGILYLLYNYPTKKKPSWNPNLFHSSVQLTKNGWWKREIEETTRLSVGRSYFQWHGTWVFWPLMRSAVRKSWWSLGGILWPKKRRRWATTKTKRHKDERGRWLVFLGDV